MNGKAHVGGACSLNDKAYYLVEVQVNAWVNWDAVGDAEDTTSPGQLSGPEGSSPSFRNCYTWHTWRCLRSSEDPVSPGLKDNHLSGPSVNNRCRCASPSMRAHTNTSVTTRACRSKCVCTPLCEHRCMCEHVHTCVCTYAHSSAPSFMVVLRYSKMKNSNRMQFSPKSMWWIYHSFLSRKLLLRGYVINMFGGVLWSAERIKGTEQFETMTH